MLIYMKYLTVLLLLNAIEVQSKTFGQCGYDNDHKWSVIGIYSACYNNNNRTESNKMAEDLDKVVKHLWKIRSKPIA